MCEDENLKRGASLTYEICIFIIVQRTGIAAGGIFEKRLLTTTARFCFKIEVNN